MSYALTQHVTFLRRRWLVAFVAVLMVAAALAASTSAHQTLVRAYVTHDGSTVVSGYDGGVPVAPAAKP